jgi:hypothetical protein
MNGLNVRETSKVSIIKGQNSLDAMYSHRGRQPRIVDLNTRHTMSNKQSSPLLVHRQAVGEQSQPLLEKFGSPVCFLRGKSVSVAVERAGTRVPEFADIL